MRDGAWRRALERMMDTEEESSVFDHVGRYLEITALMLAAVAYVTVQNFHSDPQCVGPMDAYIASCYCKLQRFDSRSVVFEIMGPELTRLDDAFTVDSLAPHDLLANDSS